MEGGREFDWDETKARSNLAKHGVPFPYAVRDAVRVFLDPNVVDFDASREGDKEVRRKAVGLIDGKLHAVVYADRGGLRRVISGRRTNVTEQRAYGTV